MRHRGPGTSIDLVFLIVFDVSAHHNDGLSHQKHKQTTAQCQTDQNETVLDKRGRTYTRFTGHDLDDAVGAITHNHTLQAPKWLTMKQKAIHPKNAICT